MKKEIHEGSGYFFHCERVLSVLGPVQMDRKAHLPEKPLKNDEAISQPPIFNSPTWKQPKYFYLNLTIQRQSSLFIMNLQSQVKSLWTERAENLIVSHQVFSCSSLVWSWLRSLSKNRTYLMAISCST